MKKTNFQPTKPDENATNASQDSKTQPSAEEQKNKNLQDNNISEESRTVSTKETGEKPNKSAEKTDLVKPDILVDDTAQIFVWLEDANQTPRQLKNLLETVDTKIELLEDIQSKQSKQAKRIPGIDKRIETMDLYDEQVGTGDRYLSELNNIKLQTELTNLNEKRFQVWQKFVKTCGSEKKALKYQSLRAKATSKLYHSKSSYFIKKRILKIFNSVIERNKSTLIEVKKLAEDTTDAGVKLFNERMRDLLYEYDEENVVLFLHVNRDLYFSIMRLTLLKWDSENDLEITELVVPNE